MYRPLLITAALALLGHPLAAGKENLSNLSALPGASSQVPEIASTPLAGPGAALGALPTAPKHGTKRGRDTRDENHLMAFRLAMANALREYLGDSAKNLSKEHRAHLERDLANLGHADQQRLTALSRHINFNFASFVEIGDGRIYQLRTDIRRHCKTRGIAASKITKKFELIALAVRPDVQFPIDSYLRAPIKRTKEGGVGGAGPEPGRPSGLPLPFSREATRPPASSSPNGLQLPFRSFVHRKPGGGFVITPTIELITALRKDIDAGRIPPVASDDLARLVQDPSLRNRCYRLQGLSDSHGVETIQLRSEPMERFTVPANDPILLEREGQLIALRPAGPSEEARFRTTDGRDFVVALTPLSREAKGPMEPSESDSLRALAHVHASVNNPWVSFRSFLHNAKAVAMAERILREGSRFDERLGTFERAGSAFSAALKKDAYFNELYENALGMGETARGTRVMAPGIRIPARASTSMPAPMPRAFRPQPPPPRSSSSSSRAGGGLAGADPAPVEPRRVLHLEPDNAPLAPPTGILAPAEPEEPKDIQRLHHEIIGDLMNIRTTVLVAQPYDPHAPLRLLKPGSQVGTDPSETVGIHRILRVDGRWTVVVRCAAFLEMPHYVDGDGTTYVEVTRGDHALPTIHDDGHALIAAIYFLRWQKPISSELIRQYHARLDQALMDSL